MGVGLISIVVPIYNVERWLNKCIQSIVDQSYKNIEIILVNDGSTDSSSNICDYWMLRDDRIKVIHKENGGLSDARNKGIEAASGEYLTFIDSDDFVLPLFVEYLYNLIKQNNADISVCQLFKVNEDDSVICGNAKPANRIIQGNMNCMETYLSTTEIDTVAWRKLYRRELFASGIRYPVGKYHEDVWTTYKLIAKCNTIAIGGEALYAYRIRKGSIVNSAFSPKHLDGIYGAVEKQKFIEQFYPSLANKASISIIYAANICVLRLAKSYTDTKIPYIAFLSSLYKNYTKNFLKSNVRLISKIFTLIASNNLPLFISGLRKYYKLSSTLWNKN